MPNLILEIPREDAEFRAALEKEFGDKLTVAEITSFDGLQCLQVIIEIILPLAPAAVAMLTTYLREHKRRIILTPEGQLSLENYSVQEAKDLVAQTLEKSAKR
jgi:hypothetical protein